MSQDDDRRAPDRRQAYDPDFADDERRIGERRQPLGEMSDTALMSAYEQTDGHSVRALELLAEIGRRGLDL